MSEARDKALHTIMKLRRLAEHPNTPPAEAEAARSRIAALQAKHEISATPPRPEPSDYWSAHRAEQRQWMREQHNRMAREYAQRIREDRERREEAERKRRENLKGTDSMGRPDPFADSRTHAQRQADLNNSFGKNDWWYNTTFRTPPGQHKPYTQACTNKATFFDEGGVKRVRNTDRMPCVICGTSLEPGEGAARGKGWMCCDTVPKPRAKKTGHSD